MKFLKTSNLYSLNKSTYVYLRWIAYIGQLFAIITIQFLLEYKFNYFVCISIVFLGVITNFYLQFKVKDNQLNNFISTIYLTYDIFQLGIMNPFGRKQETEADYLGLIFASLSGYDIRETIYIWERMKEAHKGQEPPEWMSTHPSSSRRIEALKNWIPEIIIKYPPIKNL